jgi:uncharacterized protein (DUF2225 family)
MTTLQQIELQCPICETRFRSQTVVSTNSFGGKRTDFHERAAGTQPLPYLIHTCNRCGYSGADRDFTEEAEVTAVLKERVWNELAPAITCGTLNGSEKYEAAAKVAEWQGMEPRHIADLLLRAAWCCVDEGDVEAERFFRGVIVELRRGVSRGARRADVSGGRALAPGGRRIAGQLVAQPSADRGRRLAVTAVGD